MEKDTRNSRLAVWLNFTDAHPDMTYRERLIAHVAFDAAWEAAEAAGYDAGYFHMQDALRRLVGLEEIGE